jgi:hypothetical protein
MVGSDAVVDDIWKSPLDSQMQSRFPARPSTRHQIEPADRNRALVDVYHTEESVALLKPHSHPQENHA